MKTTNQKKYLGEKINTVITELFDIERALEEILINNEISIINTKTVRQSLKDIRKAKDKAMSFSIRNDKVKYSSSHHSTIKRKSENHLSVSNLNMPLVDFIKNILAEHFVNSDVDVIHEYGECIVVVDESKFFFSKQRKRFTTANKMIDTDTHLWLNSVAVPKIIEFLKEEKTKECSN